MTVAAIALGSNLGDRRAHLDYAVSRLGVILSSLRVSRYLETDPVDISGPQNLFLNAAAVGTTAAQAEAGKALLKFLKSPEAAKVLRAKGLEPA